MHVITHPPAASRGACSVNDIAAALRNTTETLAHELARPSAAAPAWTALEWRLAEAAAAIHGVSSLLHGTLQWRGPARWQRFLDDQGQQTRGRHQRITDLLSNIDTLARRHGVAVTPLKGAALYALGVYSAGERPMADVDLLVRDVDLEPTGRLLRQLGYEESSATWKHRVFAPRDAQASAGFGEHAANPIKIDLHTRVFERLPVEDADITEQVFRQRPEPGLNDYPAIASLMTHLLLHAAGDMRGRSVRLMQLHDIARLGGRMNADDWKSASCVPSRWWALPPLSLTARYFPQAIPSDILAELAPGCPRNLRRVCRRQTLTDTSLSNLWIEAFPGIEWSKTRTERIRYIVNRVRPNRELLAARQDLAKSHSWMNDDSWTRMPQWRRMLRWVRSRPPRVETMHSVTAALAAAPIEAGTGSDP